MNSAIFESLTEPQAAAVSHRDGPLLILAGPGSGKTRVVTHRIANLLENGVSPYSILALTFTNKAADEMKKRIAALVPDANPWVGTFHRFCAQMLRRYSEYVGLEPNYSIYDTGDSKQALRLAVEQEDIDLTHTRFASLVSQISWTKNNLVTADEYAPKPGSHIGSILSEVYPAYQRQLQAANAVDFDDLLLHMATILRNCPEVRSSLDERYQYVLVDEYQDTNLAQYAIARAMSIDFPNLAVTGDPDQSIYGWRGANLNNILDFERDYPNVEVVRLEQNYRSTPQILNVADSLIGHNVRRLEKTLFTDNADGKPVRMIQYDSQKEEAEAIAKYIKTEVTMDRRRLSDFAVFFRVNALSRGIESAFRDFGLPYQIVNGFEFYQRKEIKDIFAYLHLINNPRDEVALSRIINVPSRKIGKVTFGKLVDFARLRGVSLMDAARMVDENDWIAKSTANKVKTFVQLVDQLIEKSNHTVEELIRDVLHETGYSEMLKSSELPEDEERLENIEELLTDAHEFDSDHGEPGGLEQFLERTSLISDTDAWEESTERVTLMTLHASKGLEFPVVFITAVEQGLLPHERSNNDLEQEEEERRLLFVGITRAKEELQISHVYRRAFRGKVNNAIPSRFLMELPRTEMEVMNRESGFSNSHRYIDEYDDFEADEEVEFEFNQDSEDDVSFDFGLNVTGNEESKSVPDAGETRLVLDPDSIQFDPDAEFDPAAYEVGMTVAHSEYGLGRIESISGNGKNRTATIRFSRLDRPQKIVLAYSKLVPVST